MRANLAACGFDYHSLNFIFSYNTERKKEEKYKNSYSPFADIPCGFPQGSIFGSLILNINICNKFPGKYESDVTTDAAERHR